MAKLAQSSFALDLLRRLLCAHTAGNAGSTVRADADAAAARKEEEEGAAARSPCIVARLMGLDAMPPTPTPARDQQATLRRSRSASSAEGWSSPTPCYFGDAPRRRVVRTTSASFRDRPTYLRRENDEFLLLSFTPDDDGGDGFEFAGLSVSDDDDDAEVAGSRRGKRTVDGEGGKKPRRGRRRLSQRRRRGDEEAESEHGRSRRPAAAAEECGPENSSPVSVLEARDGQEESSTTTTASSSSMEELEPCSPSSDGGETRPAPRQQQQQQGSRRKPLQADSDNLGGDPRHVAASSSSCVSKCSDRDRRDRRVVKNKAEAIAPDATGIWRIICRMVEQDICGINWQARGGGDIAAEMGSQILDQLIWEQTAELMQLTMV